MSGNAVSVIVSVYGPDWAQRLKLCLAAMARAAGPVEVIVSEQYTSMPRYARVANVAGRGYVAERRKGAFWNAGRCRNRGASVATGSILFFLDADLVMLNREVFTATEELFTGPQAKFMAAPRVHRILQNALGGLESVVRERSVRAAMRAKLSYLGNTFWGLPGTDYPVIRICHDGNIYYANKRQAALFGKRREHYHGREVEVWKPERHCGTIAMPAGLFHDVGGYSEAFRQWGCEDTDLAQKAGSIAVAVATTRLDWKFAHLEHGHGYIDVRQALRNQRLLALRRYGLRAAVQEDQRSFQRRYNAPHGG